MSKKSEYRIMYSVSCILCFLLALGIGNPPQADCAERISLKETVQKALENNLELRPSGNGLRRPRETLQRPLCYYPPTQP